MGNAQFSDTNHIHFLKMVNFKEIFSLINKLCLKSLKINLNNIITHRFSRNCVPFLSYFSGLRHRKGGDAILGRKTPDCCGYYPRCGSSSSFTG